MNYHIIAKGDCLWSIAQTHGCSLAELLAANPQITNPNNISLGEKIFLPEGCQTAEPSEPNDSPNNTPSQPNQPTIPAQPEVGVNDMTEEQRTEFCTELANLPRPLIYVVRKNDNIYQLAKCFNISIQELLKVNPHIQNPDMIYPGDKIFVPRAHASHNIHSFTGDCGGRFCPTCGSRLN